GGRRALRGARLQPVRLDRRHRQVVRARPDQHLAGPGLLLEPGGDVDRLARDERRVSVLDDDLARLDAHACLETEFANLVEDHEAGLDRPLGVVLVSLWDAERGEHGVARELLDDAAVRSNGARNLAEETV